MKLLKYQIETLVSAIGDKQKANYEKVKKEVTSKVDKTVIDKKAKRATIQVKKFMSDFPELNEKVFDYSFKRTKCDYGETIYQYLFNIQVDKEMKKAKTVSDSHSDLWDKVVITSMECETINDLKTKLGI